MAKLTLTNITSGFGQADTTNANNALIEAALENTLSRDGSAPNGMEVDLDMGSFKAINLADGVNPQDAATIAQVGLDHAQIASDAADAAAISETNAGNSETAASSSATAAAVSAASVNLRVINKQAGNYTIVLADRNKLIEYTGTGGDTITLPLTSALVDGFEFHVKHVGTGNLTVDADIVGGTTIDDVTDITLTPEQSIVIVTDKVADHYEVTQSRGYALLAGANTVSFTPTGNIVATNVQTMGEELEAEKLAKAGGTMTGDIVLANDPTAALHPASKQYVDGKVVDYIYIRDEKTSSTNGGTLTLGAWRTRDLTAEVNDAGGHASLTSNQITLAAGTYRFRASAPGYEVGQHKAKLINITDTIDYLGTSEMAPVGSSCRSFVSGRFTIAASKVFELQHQSLVTKAADGFGTATGIGIEVYAEVEFWKEA